MAVPRAKTSKARTRRRLGAYRQESRNIRFHCRCIFLFVVERDDDGKLIVASAVHTGTYGTKVFCIWHMACQVICTQNKYIKFCLENGLVSESGNIKTSAEAVYAFLTKNASYTECHTGLQDVFIEAKIMHECFKKHKKMAKEINRFCWRIPQAKAKEIKEELGL